MEMSFIFYDQYILNSRVPRFHHGHNIQDDENMNEGTELEIC